ncbi:MAG: hypothetical protein ABI651_13130 [Verrucomicrobiota bacterium]
MRKQVSNFFGQTASSAAVLLGLVFAKPVTATDLNPKLVGRLKACDSAMGVAVLGAVAYVTTGRDGLHILDISYPANPTRLRRYDTPGQLAPASIWAPASETPVLSAGQNVVTVNVEIAAKFYRLKMP